MSFKDTVKGLAYEVLSDASDLIDSVYQALPEVTGNLAEKAGEAISEGEKAVQNTLVKAQSYVLDLQEYVDKF